MKKIHRVDTSAVGAEYDDAQVGAAHRLVGTCYHQKGAHRPLGATPPVAAGIRPGLQSGHQQILEIALGRLRFSDRGHDPVEYCRSRQRIPLNEHVRRSAISVVIRSSGSRVLNDVSLQCCHSVLPNRKLRVEYGIADYPPYRIRARALVQQLHALLDRRVIADCLRDDDAFAGAQTHDAVDVTSARRAGHADSVRPWIDYDDRPGGGGGTRNEPCDQNGDHAATKGCRHLFEGRVRNYPRARRGNEIDMRSADKV